MGDDSGRRPSLRLPRRLSGDADPLHRLSRLRNSPALELAGFSIFTGADRIVSIAERIILEHYAITTVA